MTAVEDCRPAHPRRRVHDPARPVGLRQIDDAAHDRRAGEHHLGRSAIIGGKRINEVDPRDRNLAIVFQNYALYPHMTVRGQSELRPPPAPRSARGDRQARRARRPRMLGIEPLLNRKPAAALGRPAAARGAWARAGARSGRLPARRAAVQSRRQAAGRACARELVKLHRQLGRTIVHVTHDQVEAMTMGERICIMKDGRIVQVGDAARGLSQSGRHLRRRLPRQPADEPAAGAAGGDGRRGWPRFMAPCACRCRAEFDASLCRLHETSRSSSASGRRTSTTSRCAGLRPGRRHGRRRGGARAGDGAGQRDSRRRRDRRRASAATSPRASAALQRLYIDPRQMHLFDPETTLAIPRPHL